MRSMSDAPDPDELADRGLDRKQDDFEAVVVVNPEDGTPDEDE